MKQNTRLFCTITICLASSLFAAAQQDTLMPRKSLSIDAGYSITYAILFSQYQYNNSTYSPVSGAGPQVSATYNYSLINRRHSMLGVRLKIGYFQYRYLYTVTSQGSNAASNEYEYKTFLGAGFGLYMIKRIKKIGFYNEVNISGKTQVKDRFSVSDQQPQSIDLACDNPKNIYLNFQSGISFYLIKNLVFTPFLAYPIFEVSNVAFLFPHLASQYTTSDNNLYYSSFSAGLSITFYF